ncbi:hypothetical protein D8674_012763 [Pyrus ussuriensis x Pyrus communis]|uniref:PB1-like domain-containing protein n=1 Tax=Pyrus ussuriensis x Pyrus communis TaxID=2448454 RepID=A0A5N5H1F1_9ROSA|nr:hypothetical protein D8674_012763 [Pyrus ussuriensis x Pyrus communis]
MNGHNDPMFPREKLHMWAARMRNNELFIIKIYPGGELSDDFYVGGKVDFFDFCDKDFMSLVEVDNMVEELGYGNMEFIESFEPIDQSCVVIEEINGDEDDQCKLIEEMLVQVNRGKAKLALEYPVSGLVSDDFVADEGMSEGVPNENVADRGVPDERVKDEEVDFIKKEFPADEDHLEFMKFVDDHVDAHEDAITSIRGEGDLHCYIWESNG